MSKPIKVLLVTGSLGPGGTELAVKNLALGLAARGRAVPRVVTLGTGGAEADELRAAGVEVDELALGGPIRTPGRLLRLAELGRIVRHERIGIVHTFLFDADVYGMLAARRGGPWAIVTTRRAIKRDKPLHLLAYRLTNRFVDRIVANSQAVARFTLDREKAPPDKVLVIPNGVDVARFQTGDRARFRRQLGIPDDALVIGAVGNIKKVKGQAVLLAALAPVLEQRQSVVLLLAGEVSRGYGEELRRKVASLGLERRVLMPGTLRDVPDLLAALDLFVLPSLSEGMSNALMEAMAAGKAIVATDVGGNRENLGDDAGLLVGAGDPAALRAPIERLLDHPAQRVEFGLRAARRAREDFSLAAMLDRTERLYSSLVEEMFGKVVNGVEDLGPAPRPARIKDARAAR